MRKRRRSAKRPASVTVRVKTTDADGIAKAIGNKKWSNAEALAKVVVPEVKKPFPKIADGVLAISLMESDKARIEDLSERIFLAAQPMPGVVPQKVKLAMDAKIKAASKYAALALDQTIVAIGGWGGVFGGYGAFAEGQAFLGYPYLSELAQRPEYRVMSETLATEMTRKGIRIKAKGSRGNKDALVHQLDDELKRLRVMEHFGKCAEYDGFMGRAHLYVDVGDDSWDNNDELAMPIGDGLNDVSKAKIAKGSLQRLQPVEAVWCYPTGYNSTNPLSPDWYHPQMWFAMGKKVHSSRLLPFVGREVPDMLKPAYSFGGLSLSQMAKPYVDNWLRTRQSVSDLLHAFTVWNLQTDLTALMADGGAELLKRLQIFTNFRDNKGMFVTGKDNEDLKNISAPLGTLDALQAQSQEQMAAICRIPLIKLLGISPHGLNASSEGEIRTFYDTIHAQQNKFFKPNLDRVFHIAQINLWGAVDPDLFYEFEQLWSLDEKGEAEVEKIKADTDAVLVDISAIDAWEARQRVAAAEGSEYASLDLNKVIVPPEELGGGGMGGKMLGLGQGGGLGGGTPFKEAAE